MFKNLVKSFIVYGLAASIGRFIGFFLVPIYTKVFDPDEYGAIDLISMIITLISILGMMQLESAIGRHYFEYKEEAERKKMVSSAFWTILALSFLWLIVISLMSKLISLWIFNSKDYWQILIIATAIIPSYNIFAFCSVLLRFQKKPVQYTVFTSLQILSTIFFSVWLVVYEDFGIKGVFYGQFAGFFISEIAMIIYLKKHLMLYWRKSDILKLFKYSLPLVPASAGSWLNSYVNRFVMLGYLSLTEIGLYTVALKISSIFRLIENGFRMAWGPFFWENYEKANHKELFRNLAKIVSVVIASLVVIFAIFANEISVILTDKEYHKASSLTGILCLSIGLSIINMTFSVGPSITKKTIYNTIIFFSGIVINVIALFILVPSLGLYGVAISLLISYLFMNIVSWIISERLYYIGFDKVFFILLIIITTGITIILSLYNFPIIFKILFAGFVIAMVLVYLKKYAGFLNNEIR